MSDRRKGSKQTRLMVTQETLRLMVRISKATGLSVNQVQQFCLGFGATILNSGLAAMTPTIEQQSVIMAQLFPAMAQSVGAITSEVTTSKRGRKPKQ